MYVNTVSQQSNARLNVILINGTPTKWGAGRICVADRHWSVLITWLIRIFSLSPAVCIDSLQHKL